MADYADFTVIEDVWRPLSNDEARIATALLRYGSAMLRNKIPALDERLADGSLDPVLVEGVIANMVIRAMRNPDGVRQLTVDGHSATFDPKASAPTTLNVTDEEIALLTPTATHPGVGSIRLAGRFYPRFTS